MPNFGAGTFGSGTFGTPLVSEEAAEIAVLARLDAPWMLPPWVQRGRRGWWAMFRATLGAEIAAGRAQLVRIADQAFILSSDFALTNWERQLGLPPDETLSITDRRIRLIARRLGFGRPIGPRLRELVRGVLGAVGLPTVYVRAGYWAVYRLAEEGWPGDTLFLEAERRLYRAMPAAFGGQLAPWDTVNGLTFHQANMMGYAALDTLSYLDLNGQTP